MPTTKKKLSAKVNIRINAPVSKVWEGLTKPEMIKQYLHGTEAISDWRMGSPLLFKGTWKGKSYSDKGVILKIEKEKLFQYSWLSSMSGLEDRPENYSIITYNLTPVNSGTELSLTQENVANEEARTNSEKNWSDVLNVLKGLLEEEDF